MGCATCGKTRDKHCCLCVRGAGLYKWGSGKWICTDCRNIQEQLMITGEKQSIRIKTLLAGFNFDSKDLEKWKKYWYAQNVEKK